MRRIGTPRKGRSFLVRPPAQRISPATPAHLLDCRGVVPSPSPAANPPPPSLDRPRRDPEPAVPAVRAGRAPVPWRACAASHPRGGIRPAALPRRGWNARPGRTPRVCAALQQRDALGGSPAGSERTGDAAIHRLVARRHIRRRPHPHAAPCTGAAARHPAPTRHPPLQLADLSFGRTSWRPRPGAARAVLSGVPDACPVPAFLPP